MDIKSVPALQLSAKAHVWGDSRHDAREPVAQEFAQHKIGDRILTAASNRCAFCGLVSKANELHNLNDNHRDIRIENLAVADSLCHGWHHLGDFDPGDAFIAYVPGLTPTDVNHLQRTIMVALKSDDSSVRADAKQLLNWLASHREYTARAWGSHDPSVFAAALTRVADEDRGTRDIVFDGLAVVFNPVCFANQADTWAAEAVHAHHVEDWRYVHHDAMNAPT